MIPRRSGVVLNIMETIAELNQRKLYRLCKVGWFLLIAGIFVVFTSVTYIESQHDFYDMGLSRITCENTNPIISGDILKSEYGIGVDAVSLTDAQIIKILQDICQTDTSEIIFPEERIRERLDWAFENRDKDPLAEELVNRYKDGRLNFQLRMAGLNEIRPEKRGDLMLADYDEFKASTGITTEKIDYLELIRNISIMIVSLLFATLVVRATVFYVILGKIAPKKR